MEIHIHIPTPREGARFWGSLFVASLAAVLVFGWGRGEPAFAAGNSITAPDTNDVGQYSSLRVDAAGNPVVAYHGVGKVQVLHCNDSDCAGGNESITFPDPSPFSNGQHVSMTLAGGNPVLAYADGTNGDLKVMRCNDPNCAGGDESVTAFEAGNAQYTSIEVDGSGNPVVSFFDAGTFDLKLLHCNDSDCDPGGDSITSPDTTGNVGSFTSLELDGSGNPVVSYFHSSVGLKVLHCNDPLCAAGDSIQIPDSPAGAYTSLALDTSGFPAVSYYDGPNGDLKLLHCNDANCAPGGDSGTSPDTVGDVGQHTSLVLAGGNPVVSYYDATNADLKTMRCNDANCAAADEDINSPDTTNDVGTVSSLGLDPFGRPVISYHDSTSSDLKVLHCSDSDCAGTKTRPINITNIGQYALPKSCFEARDAAQTPVFTVCDNDFQGPPASNAACTPDGICDDEDPARGSVSVTVTGADFRVVESKAAPQHTIVTGKQACNTAGDCNLVFVNTPLVRPWHPWDTTGPELVPDGVVRVIDIVDVVHHYFDDKPLE